MQKEINNKKTKIADKHLIGKLDMPLMIVVIILVAFGIVMVLSASAPSALATYGNSYKYVIRQGEAAFMGLIIMYVISRMNYEPLKKYYIVIYVFSILILFLVKIPGFGVVSNGANRWILIFGQQIQPSEITKIGIIISLAGYYMDSKIDFNKFLYSFIIPVIFAIGIPMGILLVFQNHLSAGIVIALVSFIIIIMSGIKTKHITKGISLGVGLGAVAALLLKNKISNGFRSDRIDAWIHPEENARTTAYQTIQGLYAIGSGGLFGVGLGQSKQKYLYIPEAHNDFIFAILAEELGFVGCAAVLILFTILAIRGYLIAIQAKDKFGSLIAIGITTLIILQAILNIAVVTNSIPNTGISLPFLSYGGTSLIILLAGIGLLLSISRTNKKL